MSTLPDWWEPLASRSVTARRSDFSRWPTPLVGGRRSAVLILLGEQGESGPDVLLVRRALTLRNHAGQAAFPGGTTEQEDLDSSATALREAQEEVGLDPASVTLVATLPRLWIPISGFVVTPVLAWWHAPHPVSAVDTAEIAQVHRLPLLELAAPANRWRIKHPTGFMGPAFEVRGLVIWGFTAGVLNSVLDLGGWTQPWDENRFRDVPMTL